MLKQFIGLLLICGIAYQCQESTAHQSNNNSTDHDTILPPQEDKAIARYKDLIFRDIDSVTNVVYGHNTNIHGQELDLDLDIYFPKNDDLEKRPLVIWAHGGYFFYGEKANGRDLCYQLAETGVVSSSINYRKWASLTSHPDTSQYIEMVMQATLDMRAAIRYFHKEADEYGIDTNAIFVAGYSAGAFMALQAGYMDRIEEMPPHIQEMLVRNGGIMGNSGNAGYSQEVEGVISIAGAAYNTSMLEKGMQPSLLAIHGDEDEVVPYRRGYAYGPDRKKVIEVEGSANVYDAAKALGIDAKLHTFEHGGHSEPWVSYNLGDDVMLDNQKITMQLIQDFIWKQVSSQ